MNIDDLYYIMKWNNASESKFIIKYASRFDREIAYWRFSVLV